MSLLEELKEKLQTVCAEQDEQLAKIRVHEAFLGAAMQDIRDLSRAIAALEPSAVEGSSVAAYFDARRAEALLDPQPEAASPEFASDQDKALQSKLDQFLQQPFALLWGGGVEAPPGLDPHHLVEVVTRGNVLRTRAVKEFQWLSGHAPTNPEDDIIAYRPLATWDEVIQHHVHAHQHEPKPGDLDRAAAKLEDDPLAATMLQEAMDSGHADGPRIPDAERTSDESQAAGLWMAKPEPGANGSDMTFIESTVPAFKEGAAAYAIGTPVTEMPIGVVGEQARTWINGWWDAHDKDMAADWTVQPSAEAERIEDERDETWVPPPGYTYIPTQGERCVCVNLMQDGIGNFFCCNQRGETSADAERTSDESQAETAIEQTLITDDIPSIPREEIPIGAAVETYTDSGLETVKISGTTYVVDDEPERQAETQPQAAYAPVNEDEARMWSNGFEADARAKAEPEPEAKRPFWVFGKKELA